MTTLSTALKLVPEDIARQILKWSEQLAFTELIHLRLLDLPIYWSRYSRKKSHTPLPGTEDYTVENFTYLYRMTYHLRLKDDARWVWRMFAYLNGITINPYVEEMSEMARKYRRLIKRRVRPTFIEPLRVNVNVANIN